MSPSSEATTAAPYIVDSMVPMPRCAILYLAVLRELHMVAGKLVPNVVMNAFKTFIREDADEGVVVMWPSELERYFVPDSKGDVKDLKSGAEATKSLSTFISKVSHAFLNDLETAKFYSKGDGREGPWAFIEAIGQQGENGDIAFDNVIVNVAQEEMVWRGAPLHRTNLKNSPLGTATYFGIDLKGLAFRHFRDSFPAKLEDFASTLTTWMYTQAKAGEPVLESNDLPGILVTDLEMLKSRFMGLRPGTTENQKHKGPYFLIREARGLTTKHVGDMGILVRDLLWLRPSNVSLGLDQKTNEHVSLGLYFSTMDRMAYEVVTIARRDTLIIEAVAYLDHTATRTVNFHLPPVSLNQDFSMGSMMGSLRSKHRTGSWSFVSIRPQDYVSDSVSCRTIDTELSVYSDVLKRRNEDYNETRNGAFEWAEQNALVGVLYSEQLHLAETVATQADKNSLLEERKQAFRFLFSGATPFQEIGEANIRQLHQDEKHPAVQQLRNELFERTFAEYPHSITPDLTDPSFQEKLRNKEDLRRVLGILSSLDDIRRYEPPKH